MLTHVPHKLSRATRSSRAAQRRRLACLAPLAIVILSSCSSGSDGGSTAGTGSTADAGVVATAGSEPAGTVNADAGTTDTVLDVGSAPSDAAGSSCTVSSVGAQTISFTSGGGVAAVYSDYWLPAGVTNPAGPLPLTITCDDGNGTTVGFNSASDAVQFAPGTYEFQPLEVGVFLPSAILTPSAPVSVQIDAFDANHVAGRSTFDVADGSGNVTTMTVEFDLANPQAG